MEKSKELFSTEVINCPRLQETRRAGEKGGITQVIKNSMIQNFRDGSTRVLCTALKEDNDCRQQTNQIEIQAMGKKCPFAVETLEEKAAA